MNTYNNEAIIEYNAIAYYRLSKEDKCGKDESDSIANQRKLISAYVRNHPNIRIVDEAYDDGYTGTNFDRPGFCSVMKAIKENNVNCVIVKDLSRLGREYIEMGKYLEMIFPSLGVRFIAINDDFDSERARAGDDLIIPIKNIMNESYCRELSKKLRNQFRIQRSNGEFLGAFTVYGYRKSPSDKHKLILDEYAAEVVKGIFALKIKGYSQQSIADYLNSKQILSPSDYKKSNGLNYKSGFKESASNKWRALTITRILENPIYKGTLVQGKRGTPNYKIKKMRFRDEAEWTVVENNHPPIVDNTMFATVQRMLSRDTRISLESRRVKPLSGVLFCGDCKRNMVLKTVTRCGKKFNYYVCSSHKKGEGCSSHSIEQIKLETAVLHAIDAQISTVIELDSLMTELGALALTSAKKERLDMMIEQKRNDVARYQDRRLRLLEALNDNLVSREEYDFMRAKYTSQISEAQNAVAELLRELAEVQASNTLNTEWIQQFIKFKGCTELTRELVVSLIDAIYVYEDKRIRIEFNYRDELALIEELLSKNAEKKVV